MAAQLRPRSRARYKLFNHALKVAVRALMAERPHVPELGLLHAAYKVSKTLGASLPCKAFRELLAGPHGVRIRARDGAFFTTPEFTIPGFGPLVRALQREMVTLTPEQAAALVWEPLASLLDMCEEQQLCSGAPPSPAGAGAEPLA